jgi:hypothetical protein
MKEPVSAIRRYGLFQLYGYRRVTQELRNRGFHYNHMLVMKLMKQMGLSSIVRMKKYHSYKAA